MFLPSVLLAYLDPGDPDKGVQLGEVAVIAGIVLGVLVVLALLVLVFRFFIRSERSAKDER